MMTIWKFPVTPGLDSYQMPRHAKVLSVALQHGAPVMWALIDPDAEKEERWFLLVGTGHPISADEHFEFVGTMLTENQDFVFHVFERLSPTASIIKSILG